MNGSSMSDTYLKSKIHDLNGEGTVLAPELTFLNVSFTTIDED